MNSIRVEFVAVSMIIGIATLLASQGMFQLQSPPSDPAHMSSAVHTSFGNAYTLLGYTLQDASVSAGDWLEVTLFWRANASITGDQYRPRVQILNQRQTEAWATSERFHIGVDPNRLHTPVNFVSENHQMRVFTDAPPYLGLITVQLIDNRTNQPLTLPDGADRLVLTDIRITADNPRLTPVVNSVIADAIEVRCVSSNRQDDRWIIDVYWHVRKPLTSPDVRVLMHGLNADGAMIANADGPPLDGDYPLAAWLPGQTLHDQFVFEGIDELDSIRMGMYTPDGNRLPITGEQVIDNTISLSAEARDCTS